MMEKRLRKSGGSMAAAALLCWLACALVSGSRAAAQYIPPGAQQQYPPQQQYPQQYDQYGNPIYPQQQQQQYPQQYDQYGNPIYPQQQYPQQQYPQQGYPQQQYPQQQYPQQGYPQQQYPQQQYPQQQYPQQQYPQQGYPQAPGQPPSDQASPPAGDSTVPDPDVLFAAVVLGAGATSRSMQVPSSGGMQKLDTGLVPALDMHVGARVRNESFFFGGWLGYQTSVGADGTQAAPGPMDKPLTTDIRVHRFEVGVLPGVRLSSSPNGATLGAFLAYGLHAFASISELGIPRYTLHGPLLRLELELPLADGVFTLRLAPEAQLIVSVSRDLRMLGNLKDGGLAFGGEASARVRVVDWAWIGLTYRESHASADSALKDSLSDVERWMFVDAVFRYY